MTTTIVSGIFLFLPLLLGVLGVAIFSAKKNVESKNNWVSLSLETLKLFRQHNFQIYFTNVSKNGNIKVK